MNHPEPESSSPLDAFLAQYAKDKAAESIRPLKDYLDSFSGDTEAIASVYMSEKLANDPAAFSLESPDESRLGPYVIERELGRGGQGEVYLAEDTRLRRKVALKVLRHLGPGSEDTVNRFRREAEVAAKLDHPGICGVLDAGVISGTPYIAMQFVDGKTLAQQISSAKSAGYSDVSTYCPDGQGDATTVVVESRQRSEDVPTTSSGPSDRAGIMRVVQLIEQVARALHVAHDAGIIHRDIKPGNLMVGTDGQPVILDFGLARSDEFADQALTRSGELFGTPAYMSPEQLLAHRVRLDGRTDVYSLGVTLFECLACTRPFTASTREGLYQAIQGKDPPDLRKLNEAVPLDLRSVVEKSLEKDRDRRYETALEFAEELRRVRAYEPIHARPVTRWLKTRRWAQRNPGVAASLSLAFLFLTAGLVTSLVLMQEARTAEQRKTTALDQFRQMSDVAKVEDLSEREKKLWPRREHMVPAMNAWLVEAREVFGRLESHRQAIAGLDQKVHAYTAEDGKSDARKRRELHAELFKGLERNRKNLSKLEKQLAESDDDDQKVKLDEQKAMLQEKLSKLEGDERLSERLTWRFDDPADAWRYQMLRGLVKDLATIEATIKDVEDRKGFALEVKERTVTGEEVKKLWTTCVAEVAGNAKYSKEKKLSLTPQQSLVPLGKDRESGLWEFWHMGSGEKPGWEGALLSGKASMKAASGMVLVLIPGGTFWMGAQKDDPGKPNHDAQARRFEGDVHEVTLDPYFISKYELTQSQWTRIVRENPRPSQYGAGNQPGGEKFITELNPMERVSHEGITDALNRWDLVLPTEAQWEHAARAGTGTPWWCGSEVKSIQGKGNIADAFAMKIVQAWPSEQELDDGHLVHAPVGSFAANAFGLHDVLGNVWEWCRDPFTPYDTKPRPGDGLRDSGNRNRVMRGGSFDQSADGCRSAYRFIKRPDFRFDYVGCRAARGITP